MNKSSLIRLVDLLSFICLLALISSGTLLKFNLPPRSHGQSIWGLTRHEWGDIHFYISLVFLLLMSSHLLLHMKFIKSAIVGKASRENNYRLIVGLVSLAMLLVFIFSPVLMSL